MVILRLLDICLSSHAQAAEHKRRDKTAPRCSLFANEQQRNCRVFLGPARHRDNRRHGVLQIKPKQQIFPRVAVRKNDSSQGHAGMVVDGVSYARTLRGAAEAPWRLDPNALSDWTKFASRARKLTKIVSANIHLRRAPIVFYSQIVCGLQLAGCGTDPAFDAFVKYIVEGQEYEKSSYRRQRRIVAGSSRK
jgi:hypothetical protein